MTSCLLLNNPDHSAEDNFKPDSEDESSDEDDENGSSDATESEEMETGSESEAASPVKVSHYHPY